MKIRIKRPFQYQDGPRSVVTLEPGIHDLSKELAEKVLRFGKAELVVEKKAPENKVAEVPENKSKVAKVRRRRAGSKSDK